MRYPGGERAGHGDNICYYPAGAVEALRAGAYDYLAKPFDDIALISAVVNRATEKIRLTRENTKLVEDLKKSKEDLERMNETLRDLTIRDGLTGLHNHRNFKGFLAMELARSPRHRPPRGAPPGGRAAPVRGAVPVPGKGEPTRRSTYCQHRSCVLSRERRRGINTGETGGFRPLCSETGGKKPGLRGPVQLSPFLIRYSASRSSPFNSKYSRSSSST